MKNFTTKWNARDGLELFAQGWEPEAEPKAVICLVHGLGEHSGRYTYVAQTLTDAGYAVLTFDLRGHGQSGGKRGYFPNGETVLADIDLLLKAANQRYPGKPRFLYGHSLGGILVLYYTLSRKPAVHGVVATSSGLRTALEKQKAKIWLSKALNSIAPSLSIPSGLDVNGLSHDQQVITAYQADPLVHGVVTPAFGVTGLGAIAFTFQHASEFPVPLLLVHGTADPIAYASGSQDFGKLVKCDCTVKLWDGLYHETHNEYQKEQVLAYTVSWLDAHLPQPQPVERPVAEGGAAG